MKKIHVALGVHAYDIEIAAGLLPQALRLQRCCRRRARLQLSAIQMLHRYMQQNYRLASKRLALLCIRW